MERARTVIPARSIKLRLITGSKVQVIAIRAERSPLRPAWTTPHSPAHLLSPSPPRSPHRSNNRRPLSWTLSRAVSPPPRNPSAGGSRARVRSTAGANSSNTPVGGIGYGGWRRQQRGSGSFLDVLTVLSTSSKKRWDGVGNGDDGGGSRRTAASWW